MYITNVLTAKNTHLEKCIYLFAATVVTLLLCMLYYNTCADLKRGEGIFERGGGGGGGGGEVPHLP